MSRTEVEPVPVQVVNHPEPKKYEIRSTHRTFVLTATNPFANVAGYDPLRMCIYLVSKTNDVIVASSVQQAADPNNAASPYTAPNGTLVPAGIRWKREGQNEIWLAANTFPTMVGVEILRKVPE